MNKQLLKTMLLLFALIAGSSSAWAADKWVKTDPADLKTGDVVVIVDQTTSRAMSNNNGTSKAPSATAVTLNDAKDEISSEVDATLQWEVTNTNGDYTFGIGEDADKTYLYCNNTNNGVRVGSNTSNVFTIYDNDGVNFLKHTETSRYIGVYNNQDWRCYTSINTNINKTVTAFYKKTTVSGATDPSVSISGTTIATGATANISFPEDLTTISFESSNPSVATVSDAGVVTGVAAGSAKITATWTAIADKYNAGSKEFDVTVVEAAVYKKVTSVNQLVAGNEYILVATGYNKAMGAVGSNIRGHVDVTISDNQVVIMDEAVAVLTLGGSTGAWTFLASDNGEYLAYSGSSNQVHSSDDATADASKWIITDDFQLESANVEGRVLKYNSGSPRFACYANGQQTAVLFVKTGGKVTMPIAAAGWASFANTEEVAIPAGVTAYYVSGISANSVSLTEIEGGYIPANTGVLVSASAADYTANATNTGATLGGVNELKVSDGTIKGGDGIYVLANKDAGVGFYKVADTVTIPAGKCYLSIAAGAPDFLGFDGNATGIKSVDSGQVTVDSYYNLAGQRVAQPTKGLYIVNGKKVILK